MSEPFVTTLTDSMVIKLEQDLIKKQFTLTRPAYTIFHAKQKNLSITLYTSKKLVIQGKEMREFIEFYLEPEILHSLEYTHKKTFQLLNQNINPRIGSDESGKGDFFGPLVVASVYVRGEDDIKWLIDQGVQDSKLLQDQKIRVLADLIQARMPHEILVLTPEKYNELYDSFNNLNTLLAWCHAKAISSLSKRVPVQKILVDKFASEWVLEKFLQKNLGEKWPQIELEQKVRGEEDLAVAAASILARARFVQELVNLEKIVEVELPKGASQHVISVARKIVKKYTSDMLKRVAKWHFSTTQKVLENDS